MNDHATRVLAALAQLAGEATRDQILTRSGGLKTTEVQAGLRELIQSNQVTVHHKPLDLPGGSTYPRTVVYFRLVTSDEDQGDPKP